jgi:hypothetical protein
MKRTALAITLIFILFLSLDAGVLVIEEVEANPYTYARMYARTSWRDKIVVESPQNKTYNTETISLNFTVEFIPDTSGPFRYILREVESPFKYPLKPLTVGVKTEKTNASGNEYTYFTTAFAQHNSYLPNLRDGSYNLTVQRYSVKRWYIIPMNPDGTDEITIKSSATVFFTIDATPPSISVLTPENKTFYTSYVPINFTVTESVSSITYILDEQENVTITGNTTLTGLSDGTHTLTIYAKDIAGNTGISESIIFNIQTFQTTLVLASLASVVTIGLGLMVYFKKKTRQLEKPKVNNVSLFGCLMFSLCFWLVLEVLLPKFLL